MKFKLTNALVVCATFAAAALSGCATERNLWRDLERAGRPSSDELQTTQFALIGEIVAPEGRFYVAVQQLVRREMLAPRGQQNLMLFDAKRRLTASYSLATATPLWCENSRVYLWGDGIAYNVPVDPRIYGLYAEESAEGGNVIDFSRGIHKPYITREKKYGSSGGIENDPWQVEKKQPDATANLSQPNLPDAQDYRKEVTILLETDKIPEGSSGATNEWIKELKIIGAKSPNNLGVDVWLLRLGDQITTDKFLERFENPKEHHRLRTQAFKRLRKAERVDLIPRLEKCLFTEEESAPTLFDSEFLVDPPSVQAAYVIMEILATSSEVSPEVREWARHLPETANLDEREMMRKWYEQNRLNLEKKKFGDLTVIH